MARHQLRGVGGRFIKGPQAIWQAEQQREMLERSRPYVVADASWAYRRMVLVCWALAIFSALGSCA